jgi:hypothetical protein
MVHGKTVMIELLFRYNAAERLANGRGVHHELADEPSCVLGVAEVGDALRRGVALWSFAEMTGYCR